MATARPAFCGFQEFWDVITGELQFERRWKVAAEELLYACSVLPLLQFDPSKRPPAHECLSHPYLAAYRNAPPLELPVPKINMDFETGGQPPSRESIRHLAWAELLKYHPHLAK